MALEEKLESFKELTGFLGAAVFSKKGEMLASSKDSALEMDMVGTLVSNLIKDVNKTANKLGLGGSDALDVVTSIGIRIFIRYYLGKKKSFILVLICGEECPIGMIRLSLNIVMSALVEDLV